MLCALCLSMFHNELRRGLHHTSLENLKKAANSGCKICIYLISRREYIGPDIDQEEKATPFLVYKWRRRGTHWTISFHSHIAWLDFWNLFPGVAYNEVDVHISESAEKPEWWYIELMDRATDDLKTQPWLVAREAFPSRPIPENMGHQNVMRLARRWIQNCEDFHDCEILNGSGGSGWFPKRLIDLSDPEVPPRLLDREFVPPKVRYATLSHCWGPNPKFITLRTENLDEFRRSIPVNLPRSFCDAIATCRAVGINYLWIDSICILQAGEGSEADWLLHTNEMTSIYLNCYLNLSFDAAIGPENGVFVDRNPDFLQPCYIFSSLLEDDFRERHLRRNRKSESEGIPKSEKERKIETEPEEAADLSSKEKCLSDVEDLTGNEGDLMSDDQRFLRDSDLDIGAVTVYNLRLGNDEPLETLRVRKYTVLTSHDSYYALSNLPLSQRGWALQEKLLSPRVLHFMRDRIAWECGNKCFFSEYFPSGLNIKTGWEDIFYNSGNDFNLPSQERWDKGESSSIRDQWTHCVRQYTERHLSYPAKDRLAAFAAIAQRYATLLGETYLAGHFLSEMPKDLLWEHRPRKSPTWASKLPEQMRTTEKGRRRPTWSWTSVDTAVIQQHHWHSGERAINLAEPLDVQVELVNQAYKYGPVLSGCLRISGLLFRCILLSFISRDSRTCEFHTNYGGKQDDKLEIELDVFLDQPDQELRNEIYALPLVRFGDSRQYQSCHPTGGILLEKDIEDNLKYNRVGAFHTGVGGSWDIRNKAAVVSSQKMIHYYHSHDGWKQVLEII